MEFAQPTAELYIPDGVSETEALTRVTHLAVGAHQDDLEIMACHGVLACFHHPGLCFAGVVVTDGAGSARAGVYADYSDDDMKRVRRVEQKKAAAVGEYGAQFLLDHSSAAVKDPANPGVVDDLARILDATRPSVVYAHNLADKHDTHVAVTLRLVAAIRRLPAEARPEKLYGCEVWRDLDWMCDEDKAAFDVSGHENLQAALLGVFDSQIAGGKRYDLASLGRRRANATYHASHAVDETTGMTFGMDLTALIEDDGLEPAALVTRHVDRFAAELRQRLVRLG